MNQSNKTEETHAACSKRIQQKGGKAHCCYCVPHSHCEFRQSPIPQPKEVKECCNQCRECRLPYIGGKSFPCYIDDCKCHTFKPSPENKERWEKDWDAKVKELKDQRPSLYKIAPVVEFGYSVDRDDELFRVVDFGNIKKFIHTIEQKAEQRAKAELNESFREYIKGLKKDWLSDLKQKISGMQIIGTATTKIDKNTVGFIDISQRSEHIAHNQALSDVLQLLINIDKE